MKKLKLKLSLKQSLFILILIPFAGFFTTVYFQVRDSNEDMAILERQVINTGFIESSALLITSIQKERGLSANYINGGVEESKVSNIRLTVNSNHNALTPILDKISFKDQIKPTYEQLSTRLTELRNLVDNLQITMPDVMESYSEIIDHIMEMNVIASKEISTGGVGKRLTGINTLIDIQESIGRFRGYTSSIAADNGPISYEIESAVIKDFNNFYINIENNGILLVPESEKLRSEFINSEQYLFSHDIYNSISLNYTTGNYGLDNQKIWDHTTTLVTYVQNMISIELENLSSINSGIRDDIQLKLRTTIIMIVAIAILVLLVSSLIIKLITHRISRVTDKLLEMSQGGGDLTVTFDEDINDDIGVLSKSFNSYMSSLSIMISGIKNTGENFVTFNSEFENIINNVNMSKQSVNDSIHRVENSINKERESVNAMKGEMNKVDSSANALSEAITEQSTAVEESSAAVEEMIANIRSVTANIEKSSDIVSHLSEISNKGKNNIELVTEQIMVVSELSNTLQNANTLIANIAEQTGLLSMNAAIEAAHAGEAGKGFAVVADEIRKLSETTTTQSKDISENLNNIIIGITNAVSSSKETEKTFTTIVEEVNSVSISQEQIRKAMEEQSQGSIEILEAMAILKENSALVDDAISDLKESSDNMQLEGSKVFDIINTVENSSAEMSKTVFHIDELLKSLTNKEQENSELVLNLSNSMNQFTVK